MRLWYGLGRLAIAALASLTFAFACVQPAGAQTQSFGAFSLTPDNFTNFVYPDDSQIMRNVTVTNNTAQAELLTYSCQGQGVAGTNPICNPQPGTLFIPAGGSVLIESEIGLQGAGNTFTVGSVTNVPLTVQVTDQTLVNGNLTQGSITFNTTVTGVDLPTNATLTGTVFNLQTNAPVAGATVNVASAEGLHAYQATTNASGNFSIPVVAHQRTFLGNWVEQIISVTANGYDTHQSLAIPQAGQTVNLSLPLRSTNDGLLSYTQVLSYNTGLPVGRGSASADGRYFASAPFWDGDFSFQSQVKALAQLDFFDTQAGTLLWSKQLGNLLPSVDVADDGKYVLICNPGPNPNGLWENMQGFVAYTQSGSVFVQYTIPGAGTMSGCSDAEFSHDDSLIAFGTLSGAIGLYNVASQSTVWTGSLVDEIRAIAFSADNSIVFFSSGDNNLYAFNAATGAQIWSAYINGWSHMLPLSSGMVAGIGKSGRMLSVLNQSNGNVVWQYPLSYTSDTLAFTPAGDGFVSADNEPSLGLSVFNAAGVPQWSFSGGATAASFSPDGNYVGVLAFDAFGQSPVDLIQVYSRAGDLLWSQQAPGTTGFWGGGEAGVFIIAPDAQRLLIGSPETGTVSLWQRQDSPTSLVSAVLPASRSVQVGATATAFSTIINAGSNIGDSCGLALGSSLPATFSYQTTNPTTNAATGASNLPADISPGGAQSYVFAITPNSPFAPTNATITASCLNSSAASTTVGLNTLLLSASTTPVPDIVALAASGDPGYVDIPGATGAGAFAVATVNVGADATITASANTGLATLPVTLAVCQTNPTTGACLAAPAASVSTDIQPNATPTFGIFATGSGTIADSPGTNRIFVTFTDSGGAPRGETSVAVRTK